MAPVVWCLLAALLFGASTPVAKALLDTDAMGPWTLAGLLYIGAALATLPLSFRGGSPEARRSGKNLRALGGAVLFGGIVGPVLLLFGLDRVTGASAALWLNLETIATSVLALLLFRESIGRAAWLALALITVGGVVLAAPFDPGTATGALLIAAACLCWGLDNNLTSIIDGFTPAQSTAIKGTIAGTVNLSIGFATSPGRELDIGLAALAIGVGALGYGVSLVLYIRGAQQLGAGRSQMIFATAPFAGVAVAAVVFGEAVTLPIGLAGLVMAAGVALLQVGRHGHHHRHEAVVHTHRHRHDDHHHDHHATTSGTWHTHEHRHEETTHDHPHHPDLHHRHTHLLIAGIALLGLATANPAEAVDPPGVRTRLLIQGEPRPGVDLPVRIEVSWPGRPEKYDVGVPKLHVPEEAGVRLGGTGSSFGKGRTKWWTDTVVTLPDWDGPWMIGPAKLDLIDRRGRPEALSVAAKRIRQKRGGGLLGRGLGSTVVLIFAGLWLLRLYRRLGDTPILRDRDRMASLVDTCTRAHEGGSTVEFLQAALQLLQALERRGAAPSGGPSAAALSERLDRVRFGGEQMSRDACREVLEPLVSAARPGQGSEST
jgi:drug/metabolite transporter (DMT)-like permease